MMKVCSHCNGANTPESPCCLSCGRPFEDSVKLPEKPGVEATVRWSGLPPIGKQGLRRSIALSEVFAAKTKLTIGRAADCDLILAHPLVSRHHAEVERLPDGRLQLTDLGSMNGITVGGRRLVGSGVITQAVPVGIGPFMFTLIGQTICTIDNSRGLRLEARGLEKIVPTEKGKTRKLLDNINLVIEPGEFVSVLGPSGSGKSTLMDCLNGRRRATGGRVLANGQDFYGHFDNFRQSLGYVPQKDIVHTQLTVTRALYYTARLRLPTDTTSKELETRMKEVIKLMELEPHQRHAGGQPERRANQARQPRRRAAGPAIAALHRRGDQRPGRGHRNAHDEAVSLPGR